VDYSELNSSEKAKPTRPKPEPKKKYNAAIDPNAKLTGKLATQRLNERRYPRETGRRRCHEGQSSWRSAVEASLPGAWPRLAAESYAETDPVEPNALAWIRPPELLLPVAHRGDVGRDTPPPRPTVLSRSRSRSRSRSKCSSSSRSRSSRSSRMDGNGFCRSIQPC
jgi:hypothetical protein